MNKQAKIKAVRDGKERYFSPAAWARGMEQYGWTAVTDEVAAKTQAPPPAAGAPAQGNSGQGAGDGGSSGDAPVKSVSFKKSDSAKIAESLSGKTAEQIEEFFSGDERLWAVDLKGEILKSLEGDGN